MARTALHRIARDGRRYVIDTETCFCFECDEISWDVLAHYPNATSNQIVHRLRGQHPPAEVEEVIGELEWLRSTKSILPQIKQGDQLKAFEFKPGLKRVDVLLGDNEDPQALCDPSLTMLLGRAAEHTDVELALHVPDLDRVVSWLPAWGEHAFGAARLAGRNLTLTVVHAPASAIEGLDGHGFMLSHAFSAKSDLSGVLGRWHTLQDAALRKRAGIGKDQPGVEAEAIIAPAHGSFSSALDALRDAGFVQLRVDLTAPYLRPEAPAPASLVHGLEEAAVTYARQLLKGNYHRLEPVARIFHQIYEGKARSRSDDSGSHILAVDPAGDIYPARHFVGNDAFKIGNVHRGAIDEDRRAEFDDLGALTTSPCGQCWARNLCGGGDSAVHWARGGGIRRPDAAWCDGQREWFGAAIAAFNLLSSEGVDFTRLYHGLRPGKRASLWTMARAALTMKIGLRPIEEADAELLTQWENWSEATYFLGNEYGLFLATRYDREMDSLHPRGIEQEYMVVSRRGEPMGLLKIRPDRVPDVSRAWIFLCDPANYTDRGVRGSFRRLLREAASQGAFTSVLAASGPGDGALPEFLEAVGFERVGVERDGLFLHDSYHDVRIHRLTLRED